MEIIRWILFIPIAFIVTIVFGALVNMALQMFLPDWWSLGLSGLISGVTFMVTGFKVAPKITKTVKWILISLIGITGIASAIGSLLGENQISAIAPVAMLFIAFSFIGKSIEEIDNDIEQFNK